MIPPLDGHSYLTPGVHPATLDDIDSRFSQASELRRVQMESLRWLVHLAQQTGVQRIVVNGSFTTGESEPNDVDCVLLVGADFPRSVDAEAELLAGLPFLQIDVVEQQDFDLLVEAIFATDQRFRRKGMLEVTSWT